MWIPNEGLIKSCLRVRKLELKNWPQMLKLKIKRREQSDVLEFVRIWRLLKKVLENSDSSSCSEECFHLLDQYIRESCLICFPFRMKCILKMMSVFTNKWIASTSKREGEATNNYKRILSTFGRVIGFYQYLSFPAEERVNEIVKEKINEMKEY